MSENHFRPNFRSSVLFPMPWGPVRMVIVSYLQPGVMALATAAVRDFRAAALV